MCRNIRTLFNFEPPATEDEIRAAALQFVRKLSGFTKPSKANEPAFERAVGDYRRRRAGCCVARDRRPPRDREMRPQGQGAGQGALRAVLAARQHRRFLRHLRQRGATCAFFCLRCR